jgi:2-C-methyl-D-erythritol 2,4-cyclodiphosphate synthase
LTDRSRIGIGHDTHRLASGGPLRLGGVTIDHDQHLVGHSDADVLLHAVTDALLGALAQGDIGEWFPDTAAENRNRDSAEFLQAATEQVRAAGYGVANLDCIVFAQRPKLSEHKRKIAQRLAQLLGIAEQQVNVKAKTGESIGTIGREEAMAAECVVLLQPMDEQLP